MKLFKTYNIEIIKFSHDIQQIRKKMQTNCIIIGVASNFVIHPQILIFSVVKVASCATLPREIKNSNFCRYSTDMEENVNKLHFKCTDFNSSMHVTVYAECIILCIFIKGLSSSLNTILIVEKHCSDVCCGEFSVPQTDRRSKQVKNSDMENFICRVSSHFRR